MMNMLPENFLQNIAAIQDSGDYIPDDGICIRCNRLKRNHPGVEKILAARGLRYADPAGRTRGRAVIPYCNCPQTKERET